MSNNNYCQPPLQFESNNQRNNNEFIYMSNTTNLTYSDGNDSTKPAIYMGDGWCTFPDLDNFDSEILLKAFTLKEKDSADSLWDPSLSYIDACQMKTLSISALRQLEALFNLSQLLFGLSRAETVNYTFRDLQLRSHPHSFKKSGLKQLNKEGRIDFYSIFERLVNEIIDAGGLEVTLLIYKNPMLPMVRQKCLDLISNVATVPEVAYKIMRHQMWFLDHLLILVRDGEIVSDKIPALSVLIRLLKVMLIERMISAYMKLVDMQYIDCLVDIFENPEFTESTEFLPFFIKFEFITMQSLTVILGDAEYSQLWSDKAKTRLLNYCMIVLLKASGAYPNIINNDQVEQINHIFYAEQHSNKHSLAHTIMTVTELLRNDENMKVFYRYHRPFKQLIIQLYKKYGAKSLYIRTDPGISYALNHLMRVLYIKNTQMPNTNSLSSAATSSSNTAANAGGGGGSSSLANGQKQQSVKNLEKKFSSIENYNLVIDSNNKNEQCPRTCSNPNCKNEETKYKPFKQCLNCDGAVAYCSSKCKKAHISYHLKNECNKNEETEMTNKQQQQPAIAHTYNRIYSSTSTSNYQKNNVAAAAPTASIFGSNRRTSENYQEQAVFDTAKRRESSAGQELFYQSITTKKMSKFSSMNENQRRNSVMSTMPTNNQELESDLNRINPATKNVYTKRSSMKESKSSGISSNPFRRFSVFDDISNTKLKQQQQQQQQTKAVVMNETTTSSVYFVRPLKTSTAVCLPDLTRRQSLRDIEKLKKKLNSIEATSNKLTTNNDQIITKMKKNNNNKNSDSSSYNSCLSTSTDTTNSNKITNKKLKNNHELVKKRVKKVDLIEISSDLNSSVHKRRHSATDAILSSCLKDENSSDTKPKQQQQSIAYNDSSSLFYQGNKQQHKGTGGANQTKTSSSSKSTTTTTTTSTNAESITPDSSDPDDYDQQRSQVKVQRYAFNSVIDDAEEEVETERRALINEQNNLGCCSNERIDSKVVHSSNNLQQKDNNNDLFAYSTVINDDDQDLRSHCKVVKEFEKTLEFVKNASNLKVMPSLSLNQQNFDNNETNSNNNKNKGPHISLASICYDNQMSKNNIELENSDENSDNENDESDSSDSDSDSDSDDNKSEEFKQPQTSSSSSNGVNLIINNSIDSHMITNNYSLRDRIQSNDVLASNNRNKKMTFNDIKLKSTSKNRISKQTNEQEEEEEDEQEEEEEEDDFIDDEFSLFNKNETLHNTYKTSDYRTFKKPLIYTANNESKSSSSLHSTRMPIYQTAAAVRQPSFELKNSNNNRNQIFVQKHELKVFENLSVNSNQTNNNNTNDNKTKLPDLPKNSTPIFTDNATAASLNAKHRQFLNAKLNLTIMPGQQQKQQTLINNNNKQPEVKSVFLVPQVPPIQQQQQQQQKVSPVTSANTAASSATTTTTTYKTSTLKSNSNLIMDTVDYDNEIVAKSRNKIAHKIMPSDILDVSKISALENATSTNSCVIVTKADLPKDIKKCLKEEIKKDKSKCSIQ